jgi:hypothetical protein
MISKKLKVRSIVDALTYLLVNRDVEIVAASGDIMSVLPGRIDTPDAARMIAEVFEMTASLRPDVGSPFRHWTLSAHEVESVSPYWGDISDTLLDRHGLNENIHTFLVLRHLDQRKDHIHPLWCRVGMDGSLIRDTMRDCGITQAVCREVEAKYGPKQLESSVPQVRSRAPKPGGNRPRPDRAKGGTRRRGGTPAMDSARCSLDQVWPKEGELLSYAEFCDRLGKAGIDILLNKGGRTVGVSYSIEGQKWKASSLGERYQWASIEPHIRRDVDAASMSAASRVRATVESKSPLPPPKGGVWSGPRNMPLKPVGLPGKALLALVEDAYAGQETIYQRERSRTLREKARPYPRPRDHGMPIPGSGYRDRHKRPVR